MILVEVVSKRIQQIIKEKTKTQYKLSMLTGIPRSTISMIISCQVKTVTLSTIYDICSGIGMELSEFFNTKDFKLENLED